MKVKAKALTPIPSPLPPRRAILLHMSRRARILYLIVWALSALGLLLQYQFSFWEERAQKGEKIRAIAEEAASQINGDDHEAIKTEDPDEELLGFFYPGIQDWLRKVRQKHHLTTPLYTLRPVPGEDRALYIVTSAGLHRIGAEAPFPKEAKEAILRQTSTVTPIYEGERGEHWITAYAPILNKEGRVVALARADLPAGGLLEAEYQRLLLRLILLLGGGFLAYVFLAAAREVKQHGFKGALIKGFLGRLGVQMGFFFALLIALGVSVPTTFSYINSRKELVRSVGEELRTTVHLGALTIDSEDHRKVFNEGELDRAFDDQLKEITAALGRIQERAGLATDIYSVAKARDAYLIVATPEEGEGFGWELTPRPEMLAAFTDRVAYYTQPYPSRFADENGQHSLQISAYAPILDQERSVVAVLVADQNVSPLITRLQNQLLESVLYGLLGVLLAVALSQLFTRALSRSLHTLTEACQQIGQGNFDVPIQMHRRDELGVLADTLRHMIVELKARDEKIEREAQMRSNYERFFPPQILAKATRDADLFRPGGGRELVVTVLFADIRNYTALSREMPPREVARMLNEYFTTVVAEVFRYGGTLEKYIGDALMAIWGAPFPAPRQIPDATEASIAMMRAIRNLNERWKNAGRALHLEVGIGLNMGVCFVGNIGTSDYLQYAAIGATTNMAARLCSLAGPGEIVLAEEAFRALKESGASYPVEAMAPFLAKGFSDPIIPYRVLWEKEEGAKPVSAPPTAPEAG